MNWTAFFLALGSPLLFLLLCIIAFLFYDWLFDHKRSINAKKLAFTASGIVSIIATIVGLTV